MSTEWWIYVLCIIHQVSRFHRFQSIRSTNRKIKCFFLFASDGKKNFFSKISFTRFRTTWAGKPGNERHRGECEGGENHVKRNEIGYIRTKLYAKLCSNLISVLPGCAHKAHHRSAAAAAAAAAAHWHIFGFFQRIDFSHTIECSLRMLRRAITAFSDEVYVLWHLFWDHFSIRLRHWNDQNDIRFRPLLADFPPKMDWICNSIIYIHRYTHMASSNGLVGSHLNERPSRIQWFHKVTRIADDWAQKSTTGSLHPNACRTIMKYVKDFGSFFGWLFFPSFTSSPSVITPQTAPSTLNAKINNSCLRKSNGTQIGHECDAYVQTLFFTLVTTLSDSMAVWYVRLLAKLTATANSANLLMWSNETNTHFPFFVPSNEVKASTMNYVYMHWTRDSHVSQRFPRRDNKHFESSRLIYPFDETTRVCLCVSSVRLASCECMMIDGGYLFLILRNVLHF